MCILLSTWLCNLPGSERRELAGFEASRSSSRKGPNSKVPCRPSLSSPRDSGFRDTPTQVVLANSPSTFAVRVPSATRPCVHSSCLSTSIKSRRATDHRYGRRYLCRGLTPMIAWFFSTSLIFSRNFSHSLSASRHECISGLVNDIES